MAVNLTNTKNFPKPHNNASGGGGVTYYMGNSSSNIGGSSNFTTINAQNGIIDYINGKTLNYNDGYFLYISSKEGTIQKLTGDNLQYKWGSIDDFHADTITAKKIKDVEELDAVKAWITNLNSKNITTEYLTVTKQAHFFELMIDKIKSVGGSIILTAANCVVDYAKAVVDKTITTDTASNYYNDLDDSRAQAYDIFWLATDGTGRSITNDWEQYDQAICQSFNNASTGVSYNVSNKYYWRLVLNKLDQRYMNLSTGATLPLSSASVATKNTVTIDTPALIYVDSNYQEQTITTGWDIEAQQFEVIDPTTGLPVQFNTGAEWTPDPSYPGGLNSVAKGTMTTSGAYCTVFGIQLTPIADATNESLLSKTVPTKFTVNCTKARLNIGIVYLDGSSEYFPASEESKNTYTVVLNTDQPVKSIIITNADDVQWHLVNGIRLSNDLANNECDNVLSNYASIPSVGDNVVQLGYRWQGTNDPNPKSRGNAIIITAYNTIDNGLTDPNDPWYLYNRDPIVPPSYAQYQGIASESNYRFTLAHYRRTYMDATGSKFIGNFYSAGNMNNLEDEIQSGSADLWQLYIAYSNTDDPSLAPAQPGGTPPNNWTKSSVPGTSWQYMGFCSKPVTLEQGETTADAINRIEGTLIFSDYDWFEIPGGTGTPGGHWENAYKNTDDNTTPAPPNDNNGAPDYSGTPKTVAELANGWQGWYSTPQPLQGNEKYTWESQAFVSGIGAYSLWQRAIRITGADGTNGTDGNDIEFIYLQNTGDGQGDPLTPIAPPIGYGPGPQGSYPNDWPRHEDPNNPGTYIDHDDIVYGGETYTWYDNPQGVSESVPYEYMCQREKVNGEWLSYVSPFGLQTAYTTPHVWSNWGKKGMDGDGYEYVYLNCDDTTAPALHDDDTDPNGNTKVDDEYLPYSWVLNNGVSEKKRWTDDPSGVDNVDGKKKEWVSVRKKEDGSWGLFSGAALWAQYVPKGSEGKNGSFRQSAYINSQNRPDTPVNDSDHRYPPLGPQGEIWYENQPNPNLLLDPPEYIWESDRTVSYNANNDPIFGNWSSPSKVTGDNGKNGEDGDTTEFIYRRFKEEIDWSSNGVYYNTDLNPVHWSIVDNGAQSPLNPQKPDYLGAEYYTPLSDSPNNKWTDNPQGVNETYKFEYKTTREFTMPAGAQSKSWVHFVQPSLWSNWGEKGMDGDGYEYVYLNYDGDTCPNIYDDDTDPNGNTKADDEYLPYSVVWIEGVRSVLRWTDDPSGVSDEPNKTKEYVSTRRRRDGIWGSFSDGALWSQFAETGPQGQNGSYRQWVYKNGPSPLNPAHPANNPDGQSSPATYPPSGWTINPTAPNYANNEYTWCSERTISFTPENVIQYGPWQDAYRTTGDNGKNGEDGDTTEFIYMRFSTEQTSWPASGTTNQYLNPANWPTADNGTQSPNNPQKYDYTGPTGYKWNDNPTGIDGGHQFEYMCQREYKLGPVANGVQSKKWFGFTTPSLWSRYGERGMDGDGYEYVYLNYDGNTAPTIYDNDTYDSKTRLDDDYLPYSWVNGVKKRWTDDPSGVSDQEGHTREFVSTRKKSNGSWGLFGSGALWAQFVEKGAQGAQGDPGAQGGKGDTGATGAPGENAREFLLYKLENTKAGYDLYLNSDNSTYSSISIDLNFQVAHVENNNITLLTGSQCNAYGIYVMAYLDMSRGGYVKSWTPFNMPYYSTTFTLTFDNSWFAGWSDADKQKFCNTNQNITVAIFDGSNNKLDENTVQLVLNGNAQWRQVTDPNNPSFKWLVTGHKENQNRISTLYVGLEGVQSEVTTLFGPQGLQGVQSQIDGVQSGVQGQMEGMQNKIGGVQTQATTGIQNVTLYVNELNEDLTENLTQTGIDIGRGYINLKAGAVTFCDQYGNNKNKIKIQPGTGTLWAENATISGNITATSGTFNGTVYASSGTFRGTVYANDGEFTGTVNATSGSFKGTVNTNLLYTGVKYLNSNNMSLSGNVYSYTIDMNNPYNTYIIHMGWLYEYAVNLPSYSSNYEGLEFEFFAPKIGPTVSYSGNPRIMSPYQNIRYELVGDTQIVDGIGRGSGFISTTNNLILPFNKFVRVKAMNAGGTTGWWVTTGDKWIRLTSDGEPVPTKDTWIKPS